MGFLLGGLALFVYYFSPRDPEFKAGIAELTSINFTRNHVDEIYVNVSGTVTLKAKNNNLVPSYAPRGHLNVGFISRDGLEVVVATAHSKKGAQLEAQNDFFYDFYLNAFNVGNDIWEPVLPDFFVTKAIRLRLWGEATLRNLGYDANSYISCWLNFHIDSLTAPNGWPVLEELPLKPLADNSSFTAVDLGITVHGRAT